jgi:hypothetical protein
LWFCRTCATDQGLHRLSFAVRRPSSLSRCAICALLRPSSSIVRIRSSSSVGRGDATGYGGRSTPWGARIPGARVEALQRNQAFIDRYREARADHLAGREAIFPAGTWWLHRFAGVKCAQLGATDPPS